MTDLFDIPSRRMLKGYPEYRDDQPRGNDGRWSGGAGQSDVQGGLAGQYARRFGHPPPKGMSEGAMRRWIDSGFRTAPGSGGLSTSASPTTGRSGSGSIVTGGRGKSRTWRLATSNGKPMNFSKKTYDAIQRAVDRLPEAHYNLIKDRVRFAALLDVSTLSVFGVGTATVAMFQPLLGSVYVGETYAGVPLKSVGVSTMHEIGHAVDFYSSIARGNAPDDYANKYYAASNELAPIFNEEMRALPGVMQFYLKHYKEEDYAKEAFAQIYAFVHGPKIPAARYFGVLTRKQTERAFPRSIEAVRNVRMVPIPSSWERFRRWAGF